MPRRRPLLVDRLIRSLLAGLLVLLPLGLSPTQAAAAVDDQPVTITFDEMTPALPDRAGTITLSGRVTNTSKNSLTSTQVLFWRDQSPITDASSLATALTSPARQPWGSRVTKEGAFQDLTTSANPTISPGETVPFRVSAKVSDLEFPRSGGVYLIGVHVLGRQGLRSSTTLGRSRLFLPLPSQSPTSAGQTVVSVVALSSRPSRTASGAFADDHLADELAPGGRLDRLLKSAARPDVSWLVDPALIQEIDEMASANGYQVTQEGRISPGTGGQAARRWLTDFEALDRTRGYRVPFGVPDLASVAHSDLDLGPRLRAATDQVERLNTLPIVIWSATSELDPAAVELAESFRPVAIFASNTTSTSTLLRPIDTTPLVSYSTDTFSGGPGPDPRQTDIHRRQRMLAESLLGLTNDPGAPVARVVTNGAEAAADTSEAPWTRRATLRELLARSPRTWSQKLDYPASRRETELDAGEISQLRDLSRAYDVYLNMLVDGEPVRSQADAVLARGTSSWFRGTPDAFHSYVSPQLGEVRGWVSGARLSVSAQRHVIMSGQTGSFPISVTNRSHQDLRVNLEFFSTQPQRLDIPRQENVVLAAGQSTTINVQPRAIGNGPVEVWVQLTTPSGELLGKRTRMVVEATNLGMVGWLIVASSGIVLLATTFLRIRQVRRERAAAEADPTGTGEAPLPPILPLGKIIGMKNSNPPSRRSAGEGSE